MIILITPYYQEYNLRRKVELDECLANNMANPLIDQIILVADDTVDDKISFEAFSKVTLHRFGKRPTFHNLFYDVAPQYTGKNDYVIFSNSDIQFNESLEHIKQVDWDKGIALSCSRWDRKGKEWIVYPTWDSQDFWMFKGYVREGMSCDFFGGVAGCDNRITWEMDNAGYWVFNPAKRIMGKHIHFVDVRHYIVKGIPTSIVHPPYKMLYPSDMDVVKTKLIKRIAYIGMGDVSMVRAFGKIGEVRELNWTKYTDAPHTFVIKDKPRFEKDVLELAQWADIVFMKLCTPNIINYPLIEKMARKDLKIYNFTDDTREEVPYHYVEIADHCTTLFTNETDVAKMKSLEHEAQYIPVGYDDMTYYPHGHKSKAPEIVFMANNFVGKEKSLFPLSKERKDLAIFLKDTYGERFGVYGVNWAGIETADLHDMPEEEAAVYRGAKIAINHSNFLHERYTSDRLVRAMGCGCFVVSQHYPSIEKDFKVGEHLACFDTFEQLKNIIDYYLEHEEERKKIAEAGCKYVQNNRTWNKILNEL